MGNSHLRLYAIFHLNLAYSSIEEEQRLEVIDTCYWPLLRLARRYSLPLGIEAPAYTLEAVASLDPSWVDELRALTREGPCEFIGSGYSQMIGPIVPAAVNAANLRIGNDIYRTLLGFTPEVAFVPEQAYSSGLVKHYIDAGYRAIVMEWENPSRYHPEWDPEWRFYPQFAFDGHGNRIPLIWNMSIAFQKFQRYVHGEMDLPDYMNYMLSQVSGTPRAFPVYGNDAEIFNFRPGRYHTEAELEYDEWQRIERLFSALRGDKRVVFIRPGDVLELLSDPKAGNQVHLESAGQPIPVKKQGKYNISRWAVTGRNDLSINTACWNIYSHLIGEDCKDEEEWRELCYLWSSDFRTHITEKRWERFIQRLGKGLERIGSARSLFGEGITETDPAQPAFEGTHFVKNDRFMVIQSDALKLQLNLRRGLAIEGLWFKSLSGKPLICTLPHGYYHDIQFGADFYSGHLIFESLGTPKVTDLVKIAPSVEEKHGRVTITGIIPTMLGSITKTITVSLEIPRVQIDYEFGWESIPQGSLRLGHIQLNPEVFDRSSLLFSTYNGGFEKETFFVEDKELDLGEPVSFLVSASNGFGCCGREIEIGDKTRIVKIQVDQNTSVPLGFIKYHPMKDTFFYRLCFSLREMDETSSPILHGTNHFRYGMSMAISADSRDPSKVE